MLPLGTVLVLEMRRRILRSESEKVEQVRRFATQLCVIQTCREGMDVFDDRQ